MVSPPEIPKTQTDFFNAAARTVASTRPVASGANAMLDLKQERTMILEMLAKGKISAEEAGRLLDALGGDRKSVV